MKLIFCNEFISYNTLSMYEICLHCHWLGFSSFILNFRQCVIDVSLFNPINSHLCMYWNQLKKPYLNIVYYLTNWRARLSIDSSLKSLGNQTIQWESICTTFVAKVGWDSAWLSMWPIWSALRYTSASKRLGVKNNLKKNITISN